MAKVLVLEDEQARIIKFKQKFRAYDVTYVEHAQDAINALKNNVFDLICLDHDLGGTQMKFDPEDCGTLVAEYIAEENIKTPVIIHSFNGPAAKRMVDILSPITQVAYTPGYWLT